MKYQNNQTKSRQIERSERLRQKHLVSAAANETQIKPRRLPKDGALPTLFRR